MINLIKRFLYAFKCFKYAWRDYHPQRSWYGTFENWILEENPFRIKKFDELRNSDKRIRFDVADHYTLLPKRCIDKDGRVRYFPVVPDGYDLAVKHLNKGE